MGVDRELTDLEWDFLLALFEALSKAGICSSILRNYETLPKTIGNDLDIFIPREKLRKAEMIFIEVVVNHDGVRIKKFKKDTFTAWWVRIGSSPLLHIDLFNGAFYWRGRRLENDDAVVDGSIAAPLGFMKPRPAHQAFSMFITSLIWGSFYKAKYGGEIIKLLRNPAEREYFDQMMDRNFQLAKTPPFEFEETPSLEVSRAYANQLRKSVQWRWLKKVKFREMYCILRYWLWEVLNLLRPSGDWMMASEEEDLSELFQSELMNIYGECTEMTYSGGGLLSWLWFRLRYVQRKMARNALVVVHAKYSEIVSIVNKPFGKPTMIDDKLVQLMDKKMRKHYFQKDEFLSKLWRRRGSENRY